MNTKQIALVKEAYNSSDVCDSWKKKIIEVFGNEISLIQTNKWYKGEDEILVYVTKLDGANWVRCYGFDIEGKWIGPNTKGFSKGWIKASTEEVKDALIKEAKRRGYKANSIIHIDELFYKSSYGGRIGRNKIASKLHFKIVDRDGSNDLILVECSRDSKMTILRNGLWAEIIENEIPESLQRAIEEIGIEEIKKILDHEK